MHELNSIERMLRAIALQETDYIPCCFMSFTALRNSLKDDWYALARREREMGLDATLFIPSTPRLGRRDHPDLRGLPVRFHPDVQIKERRWDDDGGERIDKEIHTPAGSLSTGVRLTEDWPHRDHIPFIDDYQLPRSLKPLVTAPEDLEALRYLLQPPSQEDIAQFQEQAARARAFTGENGLLLAGGWGVGMDMADWLCGVAPLMAFTLEQPAFVDELLGMIHAWNLQRMKVVLSGGVDLFIKRAWYEGCDFVTPRFYRRSILPRLKAEVNLAHERGVKFGYICSSGLQPMLDFYLEAGIDVLIGIDPVQGTRTDLLKIKEKLGERICLWGGVSGAVTVEQGTEQEIREAVQTAIRQLGPQGLILSPVDNITVDAPLTWQNIDILIGEWRKTRAAHL